MNHSRSQSLFNEAKECIPGGVNSPVRAFGNVEETPIFIDHTQGSTLYDVDGNAYLDFVSSWGPMILGHAHPKVIEAIEHAARRGTSFGTPTQGEVDIAEKIISMVPSVEKVRFVNSGTEATMSALRLARGFTGREKIIKFAGCYHGHADCLLVAAGSGALTHGTPDSKGVTQGCAQDTLVVPYNDLEKLQQCFDQHADQIAAVIVEPVAANMGLVLPKEGFLETIRDLCNQHQSVFILDEVMTGFRLAPGGAQERLNIQPDLTCFGKIIGGGLPVGAYGGRKDIMSHVAPEGPVYQAGTLSGNPLAVAAGLATLNELTQPGTYEKLETLSDHFAKSMQTLVTESKFPLTFQRIGSMFCLYFNPGPVENLDDVMQSDRATFQKFFSHMLHAGIYLAPSPFEAGFISLAHTPEELDQTVAEMQRFCTA